MVLTKNVILQRSLSFELSFELMNNNVYNALLYCYGDRIIQGVIAHLMQLVTK